MLCGLVPMLLLCAITAWNNSSSFSRIEAAARHDLQRTSQQKLEALRDSKKQEISSYFSTIAEQVKTFSQNRMIVDAMRVLPEQFAGFSEQRGLGDITDQLRNDLRTYYDNEFASEYKSQNSGKSIDVNSLLRGLDDNAIALQHAYIRANRNPLGQKHMLDSLDTESAYNTTHATIHPVVRSYLESFGYYDIFLVDDKTGNIVYSVFKELDYATSLLSGPYAQTNFARAFNQARSAASPDETFIVDFEQYSPSYEAPASFIASPIFDGNEKVGVAVFQMPLDRISQVLAQRSGLGETGETYLVGADNLLRSDTHLHPEDFSVVASFRNPEKSRIDTEAVKLALTGTAGVVESTSYNGEHTVCAYAPLEMLGMKWAILAEQQASEAYRAATEIGNIAGSASSQAMFWNIGVCLLTSIAIGVVAFLLARTIMKPLQETIAMLKDIAEGEADLTKRLDESRPDEFGQLARWFNTFANRLQGIIQEFTVNSQTLNGSSSELSTVASTLADGAMEATGQSSTVAAAAEEMSVNMNNIATSTSEVSQNIQSVARSIDELTTSIDDVAKNAEKSAAVAGEAAGLATISNEKVAALGGAANEIGKVIEVIQDIAEQTNLLALNATIEAARAGEAGKGFAVVATEVKELAKQTAAATDDIRQRIEGIQGSTGEAVCAIREISNVINNVNDVAGTIASAVEQQSKTTQTISRNIAQTASAAEMVANGVNESAAASQEITRSIAKVDTVLQQTSDGAQRSKSAGEEFSSLAGKMASLVCQFKTAEEARDAGHSDSMAV